MNISSFNLNDFISSCSSKTISDKPFILSLEDFYSLDISNLKSFINVPFAIDFDNNLCFFNISHISFLYYLKDSFPDIYSNVNNEDELLDMFDIVFNTTISSSNSFSLFRRYKNKSSSFEFFINFLSSFNLEYILSNDKQSFLSLNSDIVNLTVTNPIKVKSSNISIADLRIKKKFFSFLFDCLKSNITITHRQLFTFNDVIHINPYFYGELIRVDIHNDILYFKNKGKHFLLNTKFWNWNEKVNLNMYPDVIMPIHISDDLYYLKSFSFNYSFSDKSFKKTILNFHRQKNNFLFFQDKYSLITDVSNNHFKYPISESLDFFNSLLAPLFKNDLRLVNFGYFDTRKNKFFFNLDLFHYLFDLKFNKKNIINKNLVLSDLSFNLKSMYNKKYIDRHIYFKLLNNILSISKNQTSYGHLNLNLTSKYIKLIFRFLDDAFYFLLAEELNKYEFDIVYFFQDEILTVDSLM